MDQHAYLGNNWFKLKKSFVLDRSFVEKVHGLYNITLRSIEAKEQLKMCEKWVKLFTFKYAKKTIQNTQKNIYERIISL